MAEEREYKLPPDVEAHRKATDESPDGEGPEYKLPPDVEAHKNMPVEDGNDDEPDVEAHKRMT